MNSQIANIYLINVNHFSEHNCNFIIIMNYFIDGLTVYSSDIRAEPGDDVKLRAAEGARSAGT